MQCCTACTRRCTRALSARALSSRRRRASDTYQGSVLSVRHRMLLRATTGCCVTDPELDLPVCIGPPPLLGGGPAGYPAVPMGVPVVALPVPIPPDQEEASAQSFTKPDGWDGHVVIAEAMGLPTRGGTDAAADT